MSPSKTALGLPTRLVLNSGSPWLKLHPCPMGFHRFSPGQLWSSTKSQWLEPDGKSHTSTP